MAKIPASPFFANGGGTETHDSAHYSRMAKKHKIQWYAREWRKHLGHSLEVASERSNLAISYISDLEKGRKRWNADHLDALAHAYGIEPEDLLWNPLVGPPLWKIFNRIAPTDQDKARAVLEAFAKKTGTNG